MQKEDDVISNPGSRYLKYTFCLIHNILLVLSSYNNNNFTIVLLNEREQLESYNIVTVQSALLFFILSVGIYICICMKQLNMYQRTTTSSVTVL